MRRGGNWHKLCVVRRTEKSLSIARSCYYDIHRGGYDGPLVWVIHGRAMNIVNSKPSSDRDDDTRSRFGWALRAAFPSLRALVWCVCFLSGVSLAQAENWPGWRGPRGDGTSAEKNLPTSWSTQENVRWKVKLPGPGNSSPIVWGNRIFLTQSLDKQGTQRAVLCFDRADGKLLWQQAIPYKGEEPTHETNPYCAATPVTDGERVIASHGSA